MFIKSFILPVITIFSLMSLSGCQQNVREDTSIQQTKPTPNVAVKSADKTYGSWSVHEAKLRGKALSIATTVQVEGGNKLGVMCLEDFPPCSPFFIDGNECELNAVYTVFVATAATEDPKRIQVRCSKILDASVLYLPDEYIGVFTRKDAFSIISVPPGGAKDAKDLITSVFSLNGSSKAIRNVKELTGMLRK